MNPNSINETLETGKPLQTISWSEKIKSDKQWFKRNADYFVKLSRFGTSNRLKEGRDLKILYDAYNGKFPTTWFDNHTNPLNATKPEHKKFPAKLRPVPILRTNLDLLMGEFPRRPFVYQVNNLSDDGYSTYQESLKQHVFSNLTQHFQGILAEQLMSEGLLTPNGEPASEEAMTQVQQRMESLELPQQIHERFKTSYKDALAIKGQKFLKRIIKEKQIKQKLNKCFKHWVIAGETYSFKSIVQGELIYKPISPLMIDYDKSPEIDMIEDGEWVIHEEFITISDAVDEFYDELEKDEIRNLEQYPMYTSPTHLYDHFSASATANKVRKLHCVWKGKKLVKIIGRPTELGDMENIEVDESYELSKELGEVLIDSYYANEIYEVTRLGENVYLRMRSFPFQRNSMNNHSKTKLPYNGRKMSDTHSENVSVLELGMPLQIMYIIVTYTLERLIAKSKNKIVLLDKNVIPTKDGWDEEKFFYYSEALGYGLINRNQMGVDKSFNQYQVLDLSMFDSIKQLIDLQMHLKQEWDDLIGISRQRKGQTYASDLVGVNERATFQSTVITDMIFNLFEEWWETELQGLLDLTKFLAVDGIYRQWNTSDLSNELLEIEPTEYCSADLGLYAESSSEAIAMKNKLESTIQPLIQAGAKASTILKMFKTENIAELENTLLQVEELQAKAEQSMAESENEAAAMADERKKDFMQFEMLLKKDLLNEEYDRKEDLAHIEGTYNTFSFQNGDANANGEADASEAQKILLEREKLTRTFNDKREQRIHESQQQKKELEMREKEMKSKEKISRSKPKKS
jgi:hypothetical protein